MPDPVGRDFDRFPRISFVFVDDIDDHVGRRFPLVRRQRVATKSDEVALEGNRVSISTVRQEDSHVDEDIADGRFHGGRRRG